MNETNRSKFETWLVTVHWLTGTWDDTRNCYTEFPIHLAFKAWQAGEAQRTEMTDAEILQIGNEFAKEPGWMDFEKNDFISCVKSIIAKQNNTASTRRCKKCHSPRQGAICHKCGDPTIKPCSGWDEPEVPQITRIRELAREVGYAIGVHGTLERDLDLIAAPWAVNAVGNQELIKHIVDGLGARMVELEQKPLGRYACTIQMNGWYKSIDLSVCPTLPDDSIARIGE